jgi:hypothetical protein
VTLPAAGWFPDPQDRSRLRWWDGRTWAGSTLPAPRAVDTDPVLRSVESTPATPTFSVAAPGAAGHAQAWAYGSGIRARSGARASAVWAWGAIAVAAVSVFLNPFALLSVFGVGLGVVGLAAPPTSAAWRTAARSLSISAIVLAVATGAIAANTAFDVLDALAHLL